VLEQPRNLSEEKCPACPGRSGTAVSSGNGRVWSGLSRASGPLTSRQDQWEEAREIHRGKVLFFNPRQLFGVDGNV